MIDSALLQGNASVLPSKIALQHIWNEFSPYLGDNELRVVLFIYFRTIAWNKASERIPYRHFVNGAKKKGSKSFVTVGVGKSNRQIQRIVSDLIGKGVVERHATIGGASFYSINLAMTGEKLRKITEICGQEGLYSQAKGIDIKPKPRRHDIAVQR